MNRYETWISNIARSVVTTAEKVSDSTVGVTMALVAVISAIPEFWGLWTVSGSWVLGLAIAGMGAAAAHTAVRLNNRQAYGVFGSHIVIAEITLLWYGGGVEMVFPLVTGVGAAVMALSAEHQKSIEEKRQDRRETVEFNRKLKLLKAEAEAEAIRNGNVYGGAPVGVHGGVHGTPVVDIVTSGGGISPDAQRKQILDIIVDRGETSVKDIMDTIKAPRSTVNKRLAELREEGKVFNANRKWSAIAPALPEQPQIHLNGNGVSHE